MCCSVAGYTLVSPVAMISTTTVCVEDSNDNPPECLLNPYVAGKLYHLSMYF